MASTTIPVKYVETQSMPTINIQFTQVSMRTRHALLQARQMPGIVVKVLAQRPKRRVYLTLD